MDAQSLQINALGVVVLFIACSLLLVYRLYRYGESRIKERMDMFHTALQKTKADMVSVQDFHEACNIISLERAEEILDGLYRDNYLCIITPEGEAFSQDISIRSRQKLFCLPGAKPSRPVPRLRRVA